MTIPTQDASDSKKPRAETIAFQWWSELVNGQGPASGSHRGALARMRRAATPIEIMQEPMALRLIARLPRHPDRVATLAGILAFVMETDNLPVARAVGRDSLDDDHSALLSENRFRRLMQVQDTELLEPMRRLVRMTKGRINVYGLSRSVLYWGDRVKKQWIFEYYGVGDGRQAGKSQNPSQSSEP